MNFCFEIAGTKMRLALSLTALAVLVGGAPDPGIWTFPDITDPTSYTGSIFNHYFLFVLIENLQFLALVKSYKLIR